MIAFIVGFIMGVCVSFLIRQLRDADKNIGLD